MTAAAHETTIVPHDHVRCHTARHMEGGDCGTRFEVRCSCGWRQGARDRAVADAIAVGHRGYSPDAPVVVVQAGEHAFADAIPIFGPGVVVDDPEHEFCSMPSIAPSKRSLASHHLTEAIRHLSAAAEFVRELPDRHPAVRDRKALDVEGAREIIRALRGDVDKESSVASNKYTPETWARECADATTGELLELYATYADGNPFGWDDEIVGILRAEIAKRPPQEAP